MRSTFEFRAARISFRDEGSGTAVILIHGFLADSELWKEQLADLKSNYRLIIPDLPAHGESQSLGYLHSMELLSDMIAALLRHLKLRKVVVIGHSLGGYVALAFAERHTDKLKGLILVNSTAAADSKKRRASRQQLLKLLPKKRLSVLKQLIESFFVIQNFKKRYLVKRYLKWAFNADEKGVAATIRGMMERKEREIILKFAPYPYLIIAGRYDPIIKVSQNRSEASLNERGGLIIFEGSGHMTPMEEPWRLNKVIVKFLRKL